LEIAASHKSKSSVLALESTDAFEVKDAFELMMDFLLALLASTNIRDAHTPINKCPRPNLDKIREAGRCLRN
jgi:hypothetical protein